jgi:hypothetical protein
MRVGLYVDGYDCNYWKRLDLSNDKDLPGHVSARFWGFKRDSDDIRAFVFATPDMGGNNQNRNIRTNIGEIKVIIHEAEITGGYFDNKNSFSNEIPSSLKAIDGDTKFWKQASVTTIAGRRIDKNKEKFPELIRWVNKTKEPSYTIQLHYHTKEMLELMQRLQLQESNLLKRKRETEHIDLTLDTDDDEDNNHDDDNGDKNNDKIDDEYLEVIKVDKEVDVLDITDESDPQWSTVTIKRGLD